MNLSLIKRIIALVLCLQAGFTVLAQQSGKISGVVVDSPFVNKISGATITLLKKQDSSLISFTLTAADGRFQLTGVPSGDYRLLITHVNFHNENRFIKIDASNQQVELGNIRLFDKFKMMSEILIQAEAPPITLKEDTVEYNAGSFKTLPNANVEELLKKLPGVKVEKDGTVKAQGQKVNRVFVDGKEFFGNDPKLATRNLPADAIDKVQVYDRQSDQSQLTGFDDGNSEKAINLKLKKDKKKGFFGKAMAGAGTDQRYEGRFNVNSFKDARQLSIIGMGNNTNAEGFSFMDILNFNPDIASMNQGGGNINININPGEQGSGQMNGNNAGINTTWAGGVNYNNLIGTKLDLRSNYFYNRFSPYIESRLKRQYILPDSTYFYNQESVSKTINNNQRLNVILDYAIDSLHSIRFAPSLSIQDTRRNSAIKYQTLSEKGELTNAGFSDNNTYIKGYNLRNDLLFRKKFNKRGRTFSLALQYLQNNNNGNGNQYSINEFFFPSGLPARTDTINQRNESRAGLSGYTARAVYTEPVLKKAILEFCAARSATNSTSDRTTYDYNYGSGKFDQINPLLSNDFENWFSYTNAGIRFRRQYKKLNWAAGAAWQLAELEGQTYGSGKDTTISKKFRNILPNARFQYNFNRFSNIMLNYSTQTIQPTVSQLQPVPDISNPLQIVIGNPSLKQEFVNLLQMNLFLINPVKNRNFFAFFLFRQVYNKIVNADIISPLGIKTTTPVNAKGVYSMNGDINWGIPLTFMKMSSFNFGLGIMHAKNKQFINTKENRINDWQLRPEIRLEMNPHEKLNVSLTTSASLNQTRYSLQPSLDTRYLSFELGTEFGWQLPSNFFISTDFNYMINARRADGFNVNVPLWNAAFSKQFLKYNRAQLGIRVNDILNKNTGITRTSNNNFIEDRQNVFLQRYFLLQFTYSLSKSGLNSPGAGGNMRVITR
jgi:hypothetical protein